MQQQRVLVGAGAGEVPALVAGEAGVLFVDTEFVVVGGMCMASAASRQAAPPPPRPRRAAAPRPGRRSTASAAARRFWRAIRLVYVLSSATALYSSGPVTPSRWKTPWLSWWPSDRHSRAVSTSSSTPVSRSKAVSPVASTYRTTASAMPALT